MSDPLVIGVILMLFVLTAAPFNRPVHAPERRLVRRRH